jgi:Family of unknown function (DUF6064)
MPEWWTYTLSDFILFSPRTYYRMIERYNAAVWPGHVVALSLAGAIAWGLAWPGPRQGRVIFGILALLWGWIAWAFLWSRYATINWAATWFSGAFAIEALLLSVIGGTRGAAALKVRRGAGAVVGIALFVSAVALYPLIAPLLGRGWPQAEVFGMMPDPTAIGTMGLLLLTEGTPRRWGLPLPVLWCLISGATLWGMQS